MSTLDSSSHLADGPKMEFADARAITPEAPVLDDNKKLEMLGYDATLGRPFGFWSALGLSMANLSFVFDTVVFCTMYGYPAPMMFMVGYPILCLLHIILIGPFAELSSAFPVSGAMATWSWRAAKAGVRHERQWGWFVSGIVLAGHLGKTIGRLVLVTVSCRQMYILMSGIAFNPETMDAIKSEAWWTPVFHLAITTVVAFCLFSRAASKSWFWIGVWIFNLFIGVFFFVLWPLALRKTAKLHLKVNWGFPYKADWTHSFSYMFFLGLPIRAVPIDGPAHMAEETVNPEKTIPRVMYASTIAHFVLTYIFTALFIFGIGPWAKGHYSSTPIVPMQLILGLPNSQFYTVVITIMLSTCTSLLAAALVSSRFIFALARDYALPFSNLFYRTDKQRTPWVAELLVVSAMYISVVGWYIPERYYDNLLQTFWLWFMTLTYVIPIGLYLFSRLDLEGVDRSQFTLKRWSKPSAAISFLWLSTTVVQGCFPITMWINVRMPESAWGDVNSFPLVVAAMILIMIASWYLYGRRHYIGPIRALTKWSAGVEIDPKAFDFDTPEGRFEALRDYLKREMNHQSPKNSNGSRAGDGTTTVSVPMLSKPIKWLSGGGTRPRTRDSSEYVELAPRTTAPALAESELVPRTNVGTFGVTAPALAESGVFPPTSHAQAGARGNWSTAESQETVVGQFSSGSDHYFERSRTQAGTQLPAIDESILDPTATHHF